MFIRKSEHRSMNPYVAITIGTLAMIGAFSVVKCTKRTVRTFCNKVSGVFSGKEKNDCSVRECDIIK